MRRIICTTAFLAATAVLGHAQPAQTPATFEIAEVSVSTMSPVRGLRGGTPHSGRYELSNATMVDLIRTAYAVNADKVAGGPFWLELDRFDVVAKVPPAATRESVRPMLQALLADRFKLVVREDTRPTLTSALTVAGSAHKMRTASGGTPNCQPQPQPAALTMTLVCRNMTMAGFADLLPQAGRGYVQGPVADATNIAGGWDFELSWTPMQVMSQAGADGVSILKALDAQLGLKVEQKSVPVTALFVDSVSRTPTPNVSGARSQIPARPSQAFDVAVIKPSVDGSIPSTRLLPTGEINAVANSIRTLLAVAWDIPDESQILGPRWMDDARFDLVARISDRPADPQQVDNIAVAQMLKNLLVERFRITAHMEDRPMPAFTLTSSSAVKLTKADPALRTRCFDGPPPGVADPRTTNPVLSRLTTCQNITMGEFAERLPGIGAGYVRTPVADATGLEGRWTFSVAFSAPAMVQGARAGGTRSADGLTAPDPNGALSLEEALQRQLGLKLEARERPVSVLVIDTIDQEPRAN